MFASARDGVLRSPLLSACDWLEHGFGTRLASRFPLPDGARARVKQIHSDLVFSARRPGLCGEGDALVTATRGLWIAVRTADCFPILIADPRRHAIAAVHAGWRGAAAGILAKTVTRLREEFHSQPHDLIAAVGPGIQACCFEVGPEVSAQFGMQGRRHIDLARVCRTQLIEAGVPALAIEVDPSCTRCDAARFHSYRRDGDAAGRMVAAIRLR